MCSYHVREKGPCGFQVVVVAVNAELDKLVDLFLSEDAERARDIDLDLVRDRFDAISNLCHEPFIRAADRSDDAEL